MNSDVIPFGKHKGSKVQDVLERDPQYLDWLRLQPGIADKYPQLFQIIINYGNEPTETPEHNALQARLLDPLVQAGFARIFMADAVRKAESYEFRNYADPIPIPAPIEGGPVFGVEFEVDGADALLKITLPSWQWSGTSPQHRSDDKWQKSYISREFLIECKPQIGEDYPAILRQIKAFRSNMKSSDSADRVLLFERFDVRSVSISTLRTIFANSHISVVALDEVENG